MRYNGILTTWKDEQGFGFVTTNGTPDKIFVHIKNFSFRSRRPCEGDQLIYEISFDEKKRPQAINVQLAHDYARKRLRQQRFEQQEEGKNLLSKIAAYPFLIYLLILLLLHKISIWIIIYYVIINIWTYLLYWNDKNTAYNNNITHRKTRRTPEDTLHFFALLGGWTGAILAQLILRHKSQKQEFRRVFWCTVIANIVILTILVSIGRSTQFPF